MGITLDGRSAVVTGAGRGQGREIALALAAKGVRVIVNDLGGEADGTGSGKGPSDEVVAQIRRSGGTAYPSYDSVADFEGASRIIEECVRQFGSIDILINCAGIGGRRPPHFWETTKEDWDSVIDVNLGGTFNTCRHALAHMVKKNYGRIVNFSSPAWLGNGASAYTASKGGVTSLSIGIAQMMAVDGYAITCNALIPIADTRMTPKRGKEHWQRLYKAGLITKQICDESCDPPGAEHIPPIVLYLSSQEAGYVNGQIIGASRGRVAIYSQPTEHKGIYKQGIWTEEELADVFPKSLGQDMRRAVG